MELLTTPLHEAKVHCSTCWSELYLYQALITQEIIDLANYKATYHENRHPNHQVEVIIYEQAPEVVELPGE